MSDQHMWDDVQLHIARKQDENLVPLKEDLAEWINRTVGINIITVENFMNVLDNGVILCKLVTLIQKKAESFRREGLIQKAVPSVDFKCWEKARSASFFARENAENFLKWCRRFGVHEAVIFESEGLVLHTQPRTVVLCLLELGRIAAKYGIEPPGLVKLEKEIDEGEHSGFISTNSSPVPSYTTKDSSPFSSPTPRRTRADSPNTEASTISQDSNTALLPPFPIAQSNRTPAKTKSKNSDLDKKVMQIADNVLEDKSQIKRISEGRYSIAGKGVFVRLLKGRHVMVRVGGGWDTLEHFLSRHHVSDPCQVKIIDRKPSWTDFHSRSPAVLSNGADSDTFLHIKAKYRNSLSNMSATSKCRQKSLDI
ncbi:growth arrest-specific protein 2-like [Limulus polyphemus]|uniref:Growth arrest-specific protein 2-like n=1 Tax=Limulus polyphemus TaxID=6850 RepID=A0ABM1B391_LIMPO|nr:growth arrest-specific protein 2-like [Limulus polyphemus]